MSSVITERWHLLKVIYFNNKALLHENIYLFGLFVMVIGLPFSMFLMSVSQIILGANWLIEGNYIGKIKRFWNNKAAVILTSIFLMHLLGLIYSEDFSYAMKDIRIKSPLFILPFILGSLQFHNKKKINIILLTFCLAIVLSSIYCVFKFASEPVADLRDIFIFVSHIRYSLLIDVAIFILIYYSIRKNHFNFYFKILFLLIALWLFVFLVISQLFTGFIIMIFTLFFIIIIYFFNRKNLLYKVLPLVIFLALILLTVLQLKKDYLKAAQKNQYAYKDIMDTSALGNPYHFDPYAQQYENGNYIWIFICEKEMETAWNKRSNIKYHERDLKGNFIRNTLIRFLTSLNYRKDAAGVNKLSDEQVVAIEKGTVNWKFMKKFGVVARYNQTLAEIVIYQDTKNPNGSSLIQRLEYWKTALDVIRKNWLIGVGTGDVQQAFNLMYADNHSRLEPEFRHRAHNQFLEFGATFGIIGLIWFLIALFYPVFQLKKFDFLYISLFIIAFLSMLTEDTLETQAGITFFTFFTSFFIFCKKDNFDR